MAPPLGDTSQLRAASNAAFNSLQRPHHLPYVASSSSFSRPNTVFSQSITSQQRQQQKSCCGPLRSTALATPNTQFLRPFSTTHITKMSTMKATGGHSAACCNMPPVVSSGYAHKGTYETIDGKKTYVTGPAKEATKGLLVVMDIFGFFDQTVQGCDILASACDRNKYAVFMPDAFDGAPLPIDQFPPDTEEKQKTVGDFFGKNSPPSFAPKVHSVVKDAQAKYPNIKEWGIVGVSPAYFNRTSTCSGWSFILTLTDDTCSSAGDPRSSP